MKRIRFSNEKIAFALKQIESGVPRDMVCEMLGISERTFYRWKTTYLGLAPIEIDRMKKLETENMKLKKIVAELSLERAVLQDQLTQKWNETMALAKQQSQMRTSPLILTEDLDEMRHNLGAHAKSRRQ